MRLRRDEDQPPLDRKTLERLLDPAFPRRRDGGERDDLVPATHFGEAAQHSEDVVADAGPRQG